MKYFLFVSIIFGLNLGLSQSQAPTPTEIYQNNATLHAPDNFMLFWSRVDSKIKFELHVKNSRWVMFGIRGSRHSDVIVASLFADKTGHFSERTLTNQSAQLIINPDLKWFPLGMFERNNFFVVKFQRDIRLECNSTGKNLSLDISLGLNTLVFASGNIFNMSTNSIPLVGVQTSSVNLLPNVRSLANFSCSQTTPSLAFNSTPTEPFPNSVDLIPGIYRLYWRLNGSNFIGEVHCRTQGWVGFGFSPNGGMDGSNVVVGFIASNGSVDFSDNFITGTRVSRTRNQSVTLLAANYSNNFSIFRFSRPVNICDSEHLSIKKGAVYVIFAFGTSIQSPGSSIRMHSSSNRGSKQINFLSRLTNPGVDVSRPEFIDFTIANAILPQDTTTYYCKSFQIPRTSLKRHVFAYEIILPEYNRQNIHHVVTYECPETFNFQKSQSNHQCFDYTSERLKCQNAAIVWAVGGELMNYFPADTGYPIGASSGYDSIYVEVHYNNPENLIGYIDKLTVRYHMTTNLRRNELGTFVVGTVPSAFGIAIPPGLNRFEIFTQCDTGVSLETRIIRNGSDIGFLLSAPKYDFNYQQTYLLDPPIQITKSDQLVTRCVYQSIGRTNFTLGGMGTQDEMCFNYMMYYPRSLNFSSCLSYPYENDYIDLLNQMNTVGEVNLGQNLSYNDLDMATGLTKAFTDFYTGDKPITESVKAKFIRFFNSTRQGSECGHPMEINMGPIGRVVSRNVYVEPNTCAQQTAPTNQG